MALLDWASTVSADRRVVAQAVLGVRVYDYVAEDDDLLDTGGGVLVPDSLPKPRRPVAGLVVWSHQQQETPRYHATTGLYGFTRLRPGTHTLQVHDPRQRFLPRLVTVTAPDRSLVASDLERGVVPAATSPRPAYVDVPLRAAIGYPALPAQTVLWGELTGPDGLAPFSRVQVTWPVDTDRYRVYSGYADANGTYLIQLRGARSPSDTVHDISVELAAHRFLPALPTDQDPATVLPADFDSRTPSGTFYDATGLTTTETVTVGIRNRLDLSLP